MTNQPTEADEQVSRDFVKALFAPDEPPEPEPDEQQKPPGYVAPEGTNPTGEAHDMHAYITALFDTTD